MISLFPHQQEALQETKDFDNIAVYHDMGLGKTFTGSEMMKRFGCKVNLIVCQKSKVQDWVEHFTDNYQMQVFDLTNKKQLGEYHGLSQGQRFFIVGVINYELAWRRKELLDLYDFTLMLDESSLIQNQKAKQTKFILKMKPAHVILLSGTPVGGKYENLWTQVHLLGWKISEDLYNRQYVNWTTIDSGGFQHKIVDKEDPYKNIDRLKSKMREHGVIFKKTEECYELPEQVFTHIRLKAPKEYWKFQKDCNYMKRYGHLYEKIYDMENLKLAHQHAKKGKGWYAEVQMIDSDPDKYLKELQDMLINKTYHTSEYEVFYKNEHGKTRKIYKLPYFPDRVAQWAILQVIEPYLIKHLISDTFSAIPDRGIHKGLSRVKKAVQHDVPNCQYCLKIDARHYYQSVNHDILKQKYRKMFKDNDLLWILDEIIDSINTAEDEDLVSIYLLDEDIDPNTGIPIGNYLSQYSGNYYFSDFDHWIKEVKHVKYYFRYMDDIVILARTKEELHQLLKEINEYFHNNMKLEIKKNYQVFPTYVRGIDYLGYRVFVSYVLLRKQTCKDMKKKMVKIRKKVESGNMMNYSEWCSINSYKGWTDYGNCFRLTQKYVEPLISYATKYYELNVKKGGKVA